MKSFNKDQRKNLSRAFGYCSTHKNLSICLTQQDAFEVPAIVRRCANVWFLWATHDLTSLSLVASKAGLKPANLKTIFSTICTGPKDSFCIDLTDGSPAKFRKNGYQIIEQVDGKDAEKEKIKNDSFLLKNKS
jgi:hypothetical protein